MEYYDINHTGAQIDEAVEKVLTGDVVTDNTTDAVTAEEEKPVSSRGVRTAIDNLSSGINEAILKINTSVYGKVDKVEGKGLSTNDFTDEQKNTLETAVQPDDYATHLTSGFADNLVGRGDATPSQIIYRPTGGILSIGDGVAKIKSIKGNTIVWNQLYKYPKLDVPNYTMLAGMTDEGVVNGMRRIVSTDGTVRSFLWIQDLASSPFVYRNHKYYMAVTMNTDGNKMDWQLNGAFNTTELPTTPNTTKRYELISTAIATRGTAIQIRAIKATYMEVTDHVFIDLTRMFGEGNEPATVEAVRALFPNDYYEYSPFVVRTLKAESIKTVGFNQWDEEWGIGDINLNTGEMITTASGSVMSKNYIRVLPDKDYYFKFSIAPRIAFYDADKSFISSLYTDTNNTVIRTPKNCNYIRFSTHSSYGATYDNDICINLSHTGYRNGEYEPYEEFTRDLPINKYFPDGMRSAGTVYDEITSTKAIKRIGVVDLGALSWKISTDGTVIFSTSLGEIINGKTGVNCVCSRYTSKNWNDVVDDTISIQVGYTAAGQTSVMVRDASYTDAASFKSAVSGTLLYYELAEPIEIELEEPINLDYKAWDFGTEEAITTVESSPLRADIIYQFNATDTIRQNKNDIESILDKLIVTQLPTGNIKINGLGEFMAATPSGDPNHALYEAAGVVWNDETKFWEYGGVVDITSSEIKKMWLTAYTIQGVYYLMKWFSGDLIRVNICSARWSSAGSASHMFELCNQLEVAIMAEKGRTALPSNLTATFYGCKKLKRIATPINMTYCTGGTSNAFVSCYELEDVEMNNLKVSIDLKDSSLFSKSSLLNIIQKAAPTSAITITVHSEVYAWASTDNDIQTALAAQPLITLISA